MKTIIAVIATGLVMVAARPDRYTDRYDNIDVEEILSNRRLLVSYVKCILDEGPCTPEGVEIKTHIVEALEERCAKCTEFQKKQSTRILGHLVNKEFDFWQQITNKYDPTGKYSRIYEKELQEAKNSGQ